MKDAVQKAAELAAYAKEKLELKEEDIIYARNRVLEILSGAEEELTADDWDAVYGELSLLPSAINARFAEIYKKDGSKAATDWFFNYCVKNQYVKKAVLDKNPRFDTSNGLTVTINKAKPEFRDPKKAKAGNSVDGGFAQCVICRENEGFGARAKRNLRTVSITLGNRRWFWQYSPYAYFNEHGIAISCKHYPMALNRGTVEKLFDFVELFPHYFIGNNAPLPRVGGSILMHNHYQGGGYVLPMQRAKYRLPLRSEKYSRVTVGVLDWYNTALRLESDNREELTALAEEFLANATDDPQRAYHRTAEFATSDGRTVACRVGDGLVVLRAMRETPYEAYFCVRRALTLAYDRLRDGLAQECFGRSFGALTDAERKIAMQAVPVRIFEAELREAVRVVCDRAGLPLFEEVFDDLRGVGFNEGIAAYVFAELFLPVFEDLLGVA